jgi:hypothetical protein
MSDVNPWQQPPTPPEDAGAGSGPSYQGNWGQQESWHSPGSAAAEVPTAWDRASACS